MQADDTTTGFADPAVTETVAMLARHVAEDGPSVGAQLFVSVDGTCLAELAIGTDGLGKPNRVDTLYALYCSLKPVTALAVAQLVDEGRLAFDDELGAVLGGEMAPAVARLRLRALLDHTAGLHKFRALWAVFTGDDNRDRLLRSTGPVEGPPGGHESGYSEYGSWHLLGKVIESVTGSGFRDHIRSRVLEPLHVGGRVYLGMADEEYAENLGRLGVNVEVRPGVRAPLLYERTRQACTEYNPGAGGRGSASSLGWMYRQLVEVMTTEVEQPVVSPAALAALTSVSRPPVADVVLDRTCAFGMGFMVLLDGHGFGAHLSGGAFGHAGYTGMSFGFGDPEHGLAVAVVYNGHTEFETSQRRRRALCNELYRELGLVRGRVA